MDIHGRANFGGMERAFSTKIMMLHDEYFGFEQGETIRLPWKLPETTEQSRKRKRTSKRSGNRVLGLWDVLPADLIVSITSKLDIIHYFAVSGVCRSWRSPTIEYRKYIMEQQQPLVVVRPKYAKRACILYNIFDGTEYKAMLPNLKGRYMGMSCGYFITLDIDRGFCLVNIMTRQELCFPGGSRLQEFIHEYHMRHVLFESSRSSRVFMAIVSTKLNSLLLLKNFADSSSPGSSVVYHFPEVTAGIADVKIFNGKMFVLTCDTHIGEFNPTSNPPLKLHKSDIHMEDPSMYHLQLLTSNDKICMVICRAPQFSAVYQFVAFFELDQEKLAWVKIQDMGSKSLFVSEYNSAVVDTTGWGVGNCVCVLELAYFNRWSVYRLNDGERIATAPVVWNGPHFKPYFWYFPQEFGSISRVDCKFGIFPFASM